MLQSQTTKDNASNIECAVRVERLLMSRVDSVVRDCASKLDILTSPTTVPRRRRLPSAITRLSRELTVILYSQCRLQWSNSRCMIPVSGLFQSLKQLALRCFIQRELKTGHLY